MGRKRTRDAGASKEAILGAAGEVFVRRGYHGASIEEVARKAGVAKGTVFLHFRSKENLLFTLMRVRLEAIEELYARMVPEDMSARERLEQLATVENWLKAEVTDISRTIQSMWTGLPTTLRKRMEELVKGSYRLYRKRIAVLFRELVGAKEIDGVGVDALAAAFMASMDGIFIRERVTPSVKPPPAKVGRALRLVFIENLARRGRQSSAAEGKRR